MTRIQTDYQTQGDNKMLARDIKTIRDAINILSDNITVDQNTNELVIRSNGKTYRVTVTEET